MAFRLKVVAGPGMGTECALDDSEVTIGRAPENAMVINDNNVSRVHARFTLAPGNRVVVADNGSRNGVYVNDRKVNQQPISPGDRVVIGQTVIELVAEGGGTGARTRSPSGAQPPPAVKRAPNGNGDGRTGNVVPMKQQNAVRPGSTKAMRAGKPGAKPEKSSISMAAVVGVVFIALTIGIVSVMLAGGSTGAGERSGVTQSATPTRTPPAMPGGLPAGITLPTNEVEKLPKNIKELIDKGDSERTSGNLMGARRHFRDAVKLAPNCESCTVRLNAVDKEIEQKILEREKAGEQAYTAGDYKRAIDQWQNAISYIDDPASPRSKSLKQKIEEMRPLIQQQPQ